MHVDGGATPPLPRMGGRNNSEEVPQFFINRWFALILNAIIFLNQIPKPLNLHSETKSSNNVI